MPLQRTYRIQAGCSQDEESFAVWTSKDNLKRPFGYLYRTDQFADGTVYKQLSCRQPDIPMTVLREAFSTLVGEYLYLR